MVLVFSWKKENEGKKDEGHKNNVAMTNDQPSTYFQTQWYLPNSA